MKEELKDRNKVEKKWRRTLKKSDIPLRLVACMCVKVRR